MEPKTNSESNNIFKNKKFSLFWFGALISIIGDQISQIALAWLVYAQTNDLFALGSVLAIGAIPKGIFILVGGVFTDRLDAKKIMLTTKTLSSILMIVFGVMVHQDASSITAIYLFAAASGLIFAFSMPPANAFLPRIVQPQNLLTANGLMMSTVQLGQILGPMIAGILIYFFGENSGQVGRVGIAMCFYLDALTFFVSFVALLLIKAPSSQLPQENFKHFSESFKDGFSYLRSDKSLFMFLSYMALINLLAVGPLIVGLPVYIDRNLGLGGGSYGIFASIFGLGSLIGSILPSFLRVKPHNLGVTVLTLDCGIAILLAGFSQSQIQYLSMGCLFCMGILGGYVVTNIFTWVQLRVLPEYMGRIMSMVLFASIGLIPLSSSVTGIVLEKYGVSNTFLMSAFLMFTTAALSMTFKPIRKMGITLNPSLEA